MASVDEIRVMVEFLLEKKLNEVFDAKLGEILDAKLNNQLIKFSETVDQKVAECVDAKLAETSHKLKDLETKHANSNTVQDTLKRIEKLEQERAHRDEKMKILCENLRQSEFECKKLKRHSYSFHVLLHNVAELENETWVQSMDLVYNLFRDNPDLKDYAKDIEGFGHRLGKTRVVKDVINGMDRC